MTRDLDRLAATEAWIFDLDNTLYAARHSLFDRVEARITDYVAAFLGLARDEARAVQKRYFRDHGTTLNGLVTLHECRPEDFLAYVHDIDYSPIPADPDLDRALHALPGRKLIFTNGDTPHAERVMERLGVSRHFEAVFDIVASGYIPKPEPAVYDALVERHGIDPARAVLFEDIARNLKPAKDLGMATVWIESDSAYARAGADDGHIDHRAGELTPWLAGLGARFQGARPERPPRRRRGRDGRPERRRES